MAAPRNTTIRDRHRRTIARDEPPCGICGKAIDYSLPHLDPGSFHVDHIIPIDKGGTDTLDNKQASHRDCNRNKSNHLTQDATPHRSFATTRTW